MQETLATKLSTQKRKKKKTSTNPTIIQSKRICLRFFKLSIQLGFLQAVKVGTRAERHQMIPPQSEGIPKCLYPLSLTASGILLNGLVIGFTSPYNTLARLGALALIIVPTWCTTFFTAPNIFPTLFWREYC